MTANSEDRREDHPPTLKTTALSVLAGFMVLFGLSRAAVIVMAMLATKTFWEPWAWKTVGFLAGNLLLAAVGIWGLSRLKPWKGWGEPVSPATRRTHRLYWLKELLAALAMLALIFGAYSKGHPFAILSNSPVPLWIAVVAIPSWLLARVLREWWRSTADEHERRASDFGRNAAAGFFLAAAPAWWVAARAGLLPQPDAMALWIMTMVVSTIGWSWRRYS